MDKSNLLIIRLIENFTIKKWSKIQYLILKKKEMNPWSIIEIFTLPLLQPCKELAKLKEREKISSGKIGNFIKYFYNGRMKASKT